VADLPGISVDKTAIRQYSAIPSFCNILVMSVRSAIKTFPIIRICAGNDQIGKEMAWRVFMILIFEATGIENIEDDSTANRASTF